MPPGIQYSADVVDGDTLLPQFNPIFITFFSIPSKYTKKIKINVVDTFNQIN